MKKSILIFLLFAGISGCSQPSGTFKQLRYDEDYSFLRGDSGNNWYHKLKFIPLSSNKNVYISAGGEIRFQYFFSRNEGWGDEPKDKDGYILTRWLAHTDLHAGKYFRTFMQLQSSLAKSRISPSSVDDNPMEVHQAFADIKLKIFRGANLIIRTGRQELMFGSQRLVSVREGANNRQSFDGVRSLFFCGNYQLDFFYSHYVAAGKNIFDDGFNRNTKFWGAYVVRNNLKLVANIDLYYLGVWKKATAFDDGQGTETRHSVGARIWNNIGDWQYDIEALYQFGKFAGKDINAWTASLYTVYKLRQVKFNPELGFKTELISGDKEVGDRKLQTFNPLFPRGAYFGLAALIGPANLVDVHPSISFGFSGKVNFDIDYDVFWRYSRNDGIYAANAAMIYSGKGIYENHIGRQLTGSLNWRPNDFIYFRSELTWFNAGAYLRAAGAGRDIIFTGLTAQLKF